MNPGLWCMYEFKLFPVRPEYVVSAKEGRLERRQLEGTVGLERVVATETTGNPGNPRSFSGGGVGCSIAEGSTESNNSSAFPVDLS